MHRQISISFKLFLSVTLIVVTGCKKDSSVTNPTDHNNVQSYFHLSIGDTLQYNTSYVIWTDSIVTIKGTTYFVVNNFPSFEYKRKHYCRKDSLENIYIINANDSTLVEHLLLKGGTVVNEPWTYRGTSVANIESRNDTIVTAAGTFTGCVRLRIQWWSLEYEILWFAPNIGLVKREFDTASARPIAVSNLDLKNYRLK